MKYKKILLGTIAVGITTLVPIATIVSCGKNDVAVKKVAKPGATTTAGKVDGINNFGKFTATPLTGTTITSAPVAPATKDKYKTGDKITVTYTLKLGYAWADASTDVVNSVYTVGNLQNGVTIPTKESVPLTFTGMQGKGTFKMPTAPTNTTVTITAGGEGTTPSTTLITGNTVTLSFVPTGTNVWTDNTKDAKTVDYKVPTLPTGIVKPGETTTAGKVDGINNFGKFTATPLTGTTITSAPVAPATKDKYKTGDKITVTYTLKLGYTWADASTDVVNSVYTVGTLQNGVTIPTKESVPLTFTGMQGKGTFKMPTAPTNTTVTITAGGEGTTPSTTLITGNTVTLSFVPTGTNVWTDNTKDAKTVDYKVPTLPTGIVKPGETTTAGKVDGINNFGKFTATPLTGTTITSAPVAPATKDKYKTGDKITVTYTLKLGYTWADASTDVVNSVYTVGTLQNGVTIPTKESVPLTFTGMQGKGTFKMPKAPTNTTVTITAGGEGTTPSTTLITGNTVTLSFVPTGTNVWTDNTKDAKTVDYKVPTLPTGIVKPGATTTAGKVDGINNFGKFTATPLTGTTITSAPVAPATKDKYKTGDKITVTYTLKLGYTWADASTDVVNSVYTVGTLQNGVTIPTKESVPLTFTGMQGKGTFKMPKAPTNTTVTITAGGEGTTPSTTLITGNTVTLSFVPTGTNVWTDNTKDAKTVDYKVPTLPTGVVKPGATTTAGKVDGINNFGKFTATPLTGTTITSAPVAPATKDKYKTGDKITVTYTLKSGYAWADGSTGKTTTSTYTVPTLKDGLVVPTQATAPITFIGKQGSGTYKMPTYTNATFTAPSTIPTTLSNGDKFTLKVKPNANFKWADDTITERSVEYTVSGLTDTKVAKPTLTTIAKATGKAGEGSYTIKQSTGMVGTIKSGDKTTKLSNGSKITMTYKLKKGYIWQDGSKTDVTLIYIVKNLTKIDALSSGIKETLNNISGGEQYQADELYRRISNALSANTDHMYSEDEIKTSSTIKLLIKRNGHIEPDTSALLPKGQLTIEITIKNDLNINDMNFSMTFTNGH